MKISFDFDSTLSTKKVQALLEVFDRSKVEVFIITSRDPIHKNQDVFELARAFNIHPANIHMTNGMPKSQICKLYNIDIHFDDMPDEIAHIQATCPKTLGILVTTNIYNDADYLLNQLFPMKSIQFGHPDFD